MEGETEEKIIQVLKTDLQLIIPGKVKRFNVVEKLFSPSHLAPSNQQQFHFLVLGVFEER